MHAGSFIGPYRIVRELGHGGMGVVYEAVHDAISRRVAIKILNSEYARNSEAVQRLFNEARAVNVIDHPGLVQISDYGRLADGTPYLVMELLKGCRRRSESVEKSLVCEGAARSALGWKC